jgi:predicted P-loop ATPase
MVMLPTPWERGANGQWTPREWTDQDDVLATNWFHSRDIAVAISVVAAALQAVAQEHAFHPVRDYLDGLEWDGLNRVEGFAANYLGADDSAYHAAVSRCTLVAAVARIFEPGCKADHIPILEGPQGTFKSSVLAVLFSPWFSDDIADLGTKDAQMQMNGVWCLEIAELASMRRADIERVNAFASRLVDRYRPSYGRHVIKAPRQCIVIGTTNSDQYLKDETGARRFWPIQCGRISIDAARRDRDQLWAEAVSLYRDRVPWWLTGAAETAAATIVQGAHYVEDAWAHDIEAFVEGKHIVTTAEILTHLGKPLVSCLRVQGCWRRTQRREGARRVWIYARD